MHISDLLVTGKMIGTIQPSLGLINNVIEYDKYRGMGAAAIAPIGTLDVAGKESNFVRALGVSPIYFEQTDKKGPLWPADVYNKMREYLKVVKYEHVPHTQFTVRPTTSDGEWTMFRDSGDMYVMTPTITYNRCLMEMQENITNAYPTGGVRPRIVGLAVVKDDKIIATPRDHIKYGSHSMSIDLPQSDIKVAVAREYMVYNGLLAVALSRLVEEVDGMMPKKDTQGNENFKSPTPSDEVTKRGYYCAWASYILMAYAGANKTPPEGQIYTATDLYDYALSYLGLPFSRSYPYLTYTNDDTQTAKLQESILTLNMILSIAGARVGGKTLPVQYLKEKGSIHTAEEVLKYYLRMPLDMGGSNAVWMQPSYNASVKGTIMVPYPIEAGENEWEINTQWPSTHKDVVVDRGEIPMMEQEGPGVDMLRLICSRDSRIIVVRKFDNEFLLLKIPVMEGKHMISNGLTYLMSYVSDPTLAPRGAVYVDRRYTKGGSVVGMIDGVRGIYELSIEGRDARGNKKVKTTATSLPGGIQDGEVVGTPLVKGKDIPKTRTEAEVKADVPEATEQPTFTGAGGNLNQAKTEEE